MSSSSLSTVTRTTHTVLERLSQKADGDNHDERCDRRDGRERRNEGDGLQHSDDQEVHVGCLHKQPDIMSMPNRQDKPHDGDLTYPAELLE